MDVLHHIASNRGKAPGPRPGRDRALTTVGYLLTVPDAKGLCTVSVNGSEPIAGVPATPGTYTGVTAVTVLLDPQGRPVHVLGAAGSLPMVLAPAPVATTSTASTATAVILPTQAGTWRVPRASWGRWGDAGDVYQGDSGSSGQLWGLACYGDQITALGASSITSAVVTLVQLGTGFSATWAARVQGCASGTLPATAPTYTGETATGTMPGASKDGTAVDITLTAAMREGIRTGAIRSLGLTGAAYGATYGAGRRGNAWALALAYTITG